ncbi:MAG: S8 family serine peptidase, partial [Candidatus Blackburnbacteria bacterium]|nr:S8 family serine peptidase [Candidatus Blackburnbacteria bacterium]
MNQYHGDVINVGGRYPTSFLSWLSKASGHRSKILGLLIFFSLLAAVPFSVYLVKQQQDIRSRAQENKYKGQPAPSFLAVFGSRKGESRYDSSFDVDQDGFISMVDMAENYLQTVFEAGVGGGYDKDVPKSRGYIVEFNIPSLVELGIERQVDIRGAAENTGVLPGGRDEVFKKHDEAKSDVLSRIGVSAEDSKTGIRQKDNLVRRDLTTLLNGLALNISADQAEKIKQSPFVKRVYPDTALQPQLAESVPLVKATDVWNLVDETGRTITGNGVRVGVIDTGIDYTHPDIGGCFGQNCRVFDGYDFVNNDNDPMDDIGHGTHVAATIAGSGTLKGIAPEAKIAAYKVCGEEGCFMSDIIAALERSMDPNQDGDTSDYLDVVNMSLGGSGDPDDPLAQSVDRAVENGVVVVVSAGNLGPSEATVSTPGVARKALTVAAVDKTIRIADFSSRGPVSQLIGSDYELIKPNISAPGVGICAALSSSGTYGSREKCLDDKHIVLQGTSMSSPHVAGVAALVKQLYPGWSPQQIKSLIMSTSDAVDGSPIEYGSGFVNALRAVQAKSLVVPGSIGIGLVTGSGQFTKSINIANTDNSPRSYSLGFKEEVVGGVRLSLSELNFEIGANGTKEVTIAMNIESNLSDGLYFNQVIVNDGSNTYRIPIFFFKKGLKVSVTPQVTNGSFYAQIRSPYVLLRNDPRLSIKSPAGNETVIQLRRNLWIPNLWLSDQTRVDTEGEHTLAATVEGVPDYTGSATLKVDLTGPSFDIVGIPDKEKEILKLQVTPNEELRKSFFGRIADQPGRGTIHWFPDVAVEGEKNVYIVYQDTYAYGMNNNVIEFIKSSDGGFTWSAIKELPGTRGSIILQPSIARLGDRLFVVYNEGSWRNLKIVSSADDGETWSVPRGIGDLPIVSEDIGTFSFKSGNGKLHLVFLGEACFCYTQSSDGVNWSRPVDIGQYSYFTRLDLAVDGDGLGVVYSLDKGIFYASSKDGINWASKEINSLPNDRISHPVITQKGKNIFIAWARWVSSYENVVSLARSSDGGENWGVIDKVDDNSLFPSIAYANGKIYLGLTKGLMNAPLIVKESSDGGESWTDFTLDSSALFSPAMVGTEQGTVHFTWSQGITFTGPFRILHGMNKELIVWREFSGKEELVSMNKTQDENKWGGEARFEGPGTYKISVSGTDVAGNSRSAVKEIVVGARIPLAVKVPGIGSGSGENNSPLGRNMPVTLAVFDTNNVFRKTAVVNLEFDGNNFVGTADLGDLQDGVYKVIARANRGLSVLIGGAPVSIGGIVTSQSARVVVGDADGDDSVSSSDQTKVVGCFGSAQSLANWSSCQAADFNDSGRVDVTDYS